MRYGSVCSGIEAASVAWHGLGWSPTWFAEIEAFPSAVLAHHWPGVPNLGDFTRIGRDVACDAIELLVGGTPCQSFSVAGKRLGLDDPRGNLTLEYLALAGRLRPRWLAWENVPGVLSDDGGRTFGTVLGLLGQLGYGWAYRVLDAQFFGVAQRRRRVFVVGHLGAWQPAAAVLFEPSCLRWDPPPRRETRERVAPSLAARTRGGGGLGTDFDLDGGLIPAISPAIKARDYKGPSSDGDGDGDGAVLVPYITPRLCRDSDSSNEWGVKTGGIADSLSTDGPGAVLTLAIRGRGDTHQLEVRQDGIANAILTPNGGRGGIGVGAVAAPISFDPTAGRDERIYSDGTTPGLKVGSGIGIPWAPAIAEALGVRRLTPRECERLQGFHDDYTLIPYNGKPAKDGPRYRALGNSMAVPVMAWIGRRIDAVDRALRLEATA